MGHCGPYHWDDEKSELLKKDRGMGLDQICQEVFMSGKPYIVIENPRYPFQYRCVAKVKRRYLTVVCEDIEDQSDPFTRIVTYWDSESHEKERFKL